MVRLASVSILGLELPLLLLWFVLATVLATITQRIADWNDMTDELVWERLAVSVGQYHSVLPRLHGEVIRNLAQLYPALISPFFFDGYVTANIRNVHVFDAWVMSSAALPAFLLARRVTGRRWAAYLLAVLAVCTPWIVYSTVLLTEVAAYPTFLWAVLAMHAAITRPSKRNDALVHARAGRHVPRADAVRAPRRDPPRRSRRLPPDRAGRGAVAAAARRSAPRACRPGGRLRAAGPGGCSYSCSPAASQHA